MEDNYNTNLSHLLNRIIIGEESVKKYDDFLKKYGNRSDEYIYEEISKVQADVPEDIKRIHVRNLDHLSNMEGFIDGETRSKINKIKELVKYDESSRNSRRINTEYYFGGSSLLLWFLLVTVLFRRSYYRRYRRPLRRPFY